MNRSKDNCCTLRICLCQIDLFRAIKHNNVKKVRDMLLKNPKFLSDPNGQPPLWKAMLEGQEEIIEMLIREFGADPHERSLVGNKYTFLQHAAKSCDPKLLKVAEILISHGADVNAPVRNEFYDSNNIIETAVYIAIRVENLPFVELLLKNGAELNFETEDFALLMSDVFKQKSRKEMLTLLQKHGLETGYQKEWGGNALHLLIKSVERDDLDAVEIAKILVNSGISVNEPDEKLLSPMHHCISRRHVELVSFLIKNGADISQRDKLKRTFLFNATLKDCQEIIELMLLHGADVDAKDYKGQTALHQACLLHRPKLISLLIREGADISVEDDDGNTPFLLLKNDIAGSNGYHEIIIKEISKLRFEDKFVSAKDMNFIMSNAWAQKAFNVFATELSQMSSTKFYRPFSYYNVLKMSKNIKKLAHLTKNEEFLAKFKANIGSFSYYRNDLRKIMNKARRVKDELKAVESRLEYIFADYFPDIIIRNLAGYLFLEDLPLN